MSRSLTLLCANHLKSFEVQIKSLEHQQSTCDAREANASSWQIKEGFLQAISEQVDPVKSWMESSIRTPLSEQLSRLETSTHVSIDYSRQGSDDIRALSESLSSFSSHVSKQLIELREYVERKLESGSGSPVSTGQMEFTKTLRYGCGALLGIEQLFVDKRCLSCGANFNGSLEWRYLGEHLLDDHFFADCDVDVTYASWEEYLEHLIGFHNATAIKAAAGELFELSTKQGSSRPLFRGELPLGCRQHYLEQWLDARDNDNIHLLGYDLDAHLDFECFLNQLNGAHLDPQVRYFADFRKPTLNLFWDLIKRMSCIEERYIVNGIGYEAHLHDLDDSDSTNSDFWPELYSTRIEFDSERGEEQTIFTWIFGFMPITCRSLALAQFKIYLRHIQRYRSISFHSEITFIRLLRNLEMQGILRFGRRLSNTAWTTIWSQVRQPTQENNLHSWNWRPTIDDWLLDSIGASNTKRILLSQQSEFCSPRKPEVIRWMLNSLELWIYQTPNLDLFAPTSEGAVDSRGSTPPKTHKNTQPLGNWDVRSSSWQSFISKSQSATDDDGISQNSSLLLSHVSTRRTTSPDRETAYGWTPQQPLEQSPPVQPSSTVDRARVIHAEFINGHRRLKTLVEELDPSGAGALEALAAIEMTARQIKGFWKAGMLEFIPKGELAVVAKPRGRSRSF